MTRSSPLRCRNVEGEPVDIRPRRGHTARHHRRSAGEAAHRDARWHRDRRQLQPAERRRRGLPRRRRGPARRSRVWNRSAIWKAGRRWDASRRGWASGPVGAVEKLFSRTRIRLRRPGLIEINEAFAVQVLAVLSGWGVKLADVDDRLNVNGSGISLGHPIGATGVRILTTMLHELRTPRWRIGAWKRCASGAARASRHCSGGWPNECRR